jgi:hypothetical protein
MTKQTAAHQSSVMAGQFPELPVGREVFMTN